MVHQPNKDNTTTPPKGMEYEPMLATGFIDGKLLQKAIDTWGVDAQVEMIKEECLELALAIQKFARVRGDKTKKYNDIIDEIADVKIMIEQAQKIFSQDLINQRVDYKMNRLKDRLSEGVG